jgi:DNA topoisomerase-1
VFVSPEGLSAGLEAQLDTVSAGQTDYRQVLRDFWQPFEGLTTSLVDVRVSEVIDVLDAKLGPHFFSGDVNRWNPGETHTVYLAPQLRSHSAPLCAGPLAGAERTTGDGEATEGLGLGPLSEAEEAQRRRCPSCTSGRLGARPPPGCSVTRLAAWLGASYSGVKVAHRTSRV